MNSNRRAVTLQDVVMGKKGIGYTLAEMVTILTHYNIAPVLHRRRGRKLTLFQQLHSLDHDKGGLTKYNRREILSSRMLPVEGFPGAGSLGPDTAGESDIEEVAKLPKPFVQPARSFLAFLTTCLVCYETQTRRHFPRLRITAECDHEPTICSPCLQHAIDSQIGSRAWDTLTCPLCPAKLPFEAVKAHSSPNCFEKYDRHATMHALKGVQKFCICLGPGCSSGQVHSSGHRQPIMTCNACHFKTCFTHQMPWHASLTCAEYDDKHKRQNEENEASLALLQNLGLNCPSCSLKGIKESGCDHMTCPSCSYEYCYRCLSSYELIQEEGNTAHKPTCPYHSSRLPSDAMAAPEEFLDENGILRPWADEVNEGDGSNGEDLRPMVLDRAPPVINPAQRQPRFNPPHAYRQEVGGPHRFGPRHATGDINN